MDKDSKMPCTFHFALYSFPLFVIMALHGDFLWERKKWEGQLFSFPGVVRAPLPLLGVAGVGF